MVTYWAESGRLVFDVVIVFSFRWCLSCQWIVENLPLAVMFAGTVEMFLNRSNRICTSRELAALCIDCSNRHKLFRAWRIVVYRMPHHMKAPCNFVPTVSRHWGPQEQIFCPEPNDGAELGCHRLQMVLFLVLTAVWEDLIAKMDWSIFLANLYDPGSLGTGILVAPMDLHGLVMNWSGLTIVGKAGLWQRRQLWRTLAEAHAATL